MSLVDTVSQKAAEAKKAIVAFAAVVAAVVAVVAPAYSDEAAYIVGAAVAGLGAVATYRVENAPPADSWVD
jgi:hypothetical protein